MGPNQVPELVDKELSKELKGKLQIFLMFSNVKKLGWVKNWVVI